MNLQKISASKRSSNCETEYLLLPCRNFKNIKFHEHFPTSQQFSTTPQSSKTLLIRFSSNSNEIHHPQFSRNRRRSLTLISVLHAAADSLHAERNKGKTRSIVQTPERDRYLVTFESKLSQSGHGRERK